MRGLIFLYLTEEESKLLTHILQLPSFKAIGDYVAKLVQRLLYYIASVLCLSDSDKDWHFPILITLREKTGKLEE